jgi:15-cis-phytoene synthase
MPGDAYRHCESLVREADKDRFVATLFAPADRRPHLFALYAFNVETARVRHLVREPMAGEIRLRWWHEAIDGLRAEEAAANPVAAALLDTIAACRLPRQPLLDAIEDRRQALSGEGTTGAETAIFLIAAQILAPEGGDLASAAADAGAAYALVHQDVASREHALLHYATFRGRHLGLPASALPAFLPVALVPLLARNPDPPQWRRQWSLWRAARFGFPR